jgi:hypothetical protein
MSARDARRREPPGEQQHGDAGRRGEQHQAVGELVLARLHRLVDGDRERLRLAGMLPATISVAPNSPRARAKASSTPARMPRQASGSVTRKNTAARRGRAPRRLLELRVDVLERRPRRLADEREGDDRRGDHRALPGEDEVDAEAALEPAAEPAAPADHHQQVVAEHGRRQHHRQEQDRVDQLAPREAVAREREADGDAEHEVDAGRPERDLERQAEGDPGGSTLRACRSRASRARLAGRREHEGDEASAPRRVRRRRRAGRSGRPAASRSAPTKATFTLPGRTAASVA